jgi:hypothetical protein
MFKETYLAFIPLEQVHLILKDAPFRLLLDLSNDTLDVLDILSGCVSGSWIHIHILLDLDYSLVQMFLCIIGILLETPD